MKFESKWTEHIAYKGLQVLVGVAILIFAHLIAKVVSNTLMKMGMGELTLIKEDGVTQQEKTQQKAKTNLIFLTLGNMSYYAVMILACFIVLRILGIESTSLIAVLGTTGLAIGLAIQGTLSDIASGVLLAIFQTYSIGEIIEVDGNIGKVVDFTILNTVIEDIETNTIITIPNRKIQESIIQNHTRNPVRYVMYNIAIANQSIEMEKLRISLKQELSQMEGVLTDPAPSIDVQDVTAFATILQIKIAIESRYFIELNDPLRTKVRDILIANKVPLKT